ncbi:ATP-binding protein [Persephonella sp. KM09-Lau-8]|uniref:ATP-binding protein n=1 Tax=Persephonella sp. KM09-Lau-8 TaxID=1158345 RepID=UPI00049673DA|nr:ATP-binding protein [Persephonella sp. KM09-Lau-8]
MSKIGTVFGEASTNKFTFIFPRDLEQSLKNAFVYVDMKEYRVVGKVVDIITENPLLSPETIKFFVEKKKIGSEISKYLKSERFMFFTAECEVLGELSGNDITALTKPVETGADVFFLEAENLETLFFEDKPYNLYPGYIQTPNEEENSAKFSLKGDEIITMHCGIFGMTGMGKTTTTGTLLEELTIRGAKSIIFDPHGDYINLGIVKDKFSDFIKDRFNENKYFENFLRDYQKYLIEKWNLWIQDKINSNLRLENFCEEKNFEFENKLDELLLQEMCRELELDSLLFRLVMLISVLEKEIPNIDNEEELYKELDEFLRKYEYSFHKFKEEADIPEEILYRVIKLTLAAFPSIEFDYTDYDKYYILNLISAFSGEEITEAQEGHFINWFDDLENDMYVGNNREFLDELLMEARALPTNDRSRTAIIRKIEKAITTLEILYKNGIIPINNKNFIVDFALQNGKYNIVSNIIFDLSDVSPEIMQRGLLYDVVYNAFSKYKSKELSIDNGDSQITFVIEEARVLIPKSGIEDIDHPASKAARNIVRRVATEGRKMGLGLIIISQKPSVVDNIPVSQCNTLILHRVINPEDLSFVKSVGESISEEDIENLKLVERGVSIITGTALKIRKSLMVKFRNRLSKEGREHPQPLKNLWNK